MDSINTFWSIDYSICYLFRFNNAQKNDKIENEKGSIFHCDYFLIQFIDLVHLHSEL